jgi:asparagine synthase (glutamine-hydrolysing)
MSGIAAVLRLDPAPPELALLERIVAAMAFRGPDRADTRTQGSFCAGMTAVAGSSGGQFAAEEQILLVCTARIDGRKELVEALRRHARVPREDASEAELLLHAYSVWDTAFPAHVIGDFAVVLWDGQQRRLFAAVDRFAVRPLFYAELGSRLILSNTPNAILESGAISDALDETALGDILALGYPVDANATVHRDIRRLPAAHRLIATQGRLTVEPYWEIPSTSEYLFYRSRTDYAEHFREVFFRAVADRLPPSGPINVTMSGGMDSTSVAAAACAILGREAAAGRVIAHTIVHRELEGEGEGALAELVGQWLGIRVHKVAAEDFRLWSPAEDEEEWVPPQPAFPRGLTVEATLGRNLAAAGGLVLSGLGGDPLLASSGATLWNLIRTRGPRAIADLVRYVRIFGALPPLGILGRLERLLGTPTFAVPVWLDRAFARRTGLVERVLHHRAQVMHTPQQQLLTSSSWSHVLSKGDPGQAGFLIDQRHPFMDARLLEFVLRLPPPVLLDKAVLRQAMSGSLPEAVLERPKRRLENMTAVAERQHAETVPRYAELLEQVPQIADYVDVSILRRCLAEPNERTVIGLMQFEIVAHWLAARGRKRGQVDRALPVVYTST